MLAVWSVLFGWLSMFGPAICESAVPTARTGGELLIALPSWAGEQPHRWHSTQKDTAVLLGSGATMEQAQKEGGNPLICINSTFPLQQQHSVPQGWK